MALALDGSVLGGTGLSTATSLVVSLTTANAGDVIVVFAVCNGAAASGTPATISDSAGLTWTLRAYEPQFDVSGEYHTVAEWYAIAPTALNNDQITVSQPNNFILSVAAFGVSGADTASPFDPSASLPAVTTGASPVVSTNAANTMVICGARMTGSYRAPGNLPAPWTTITANDWDLTGYQVFDAPQSNLTIPLPGGTTADGMIGDAIVAAAIAASSPARGAAGAAGRAEAIVATSALPIGLGGPPRGPKSILAVRGIFRRRWRRYGLSYSSSGPAISLSIGGGAGGGWAAMAFLGTAEDAGTAAGASTGRTSAAGELQVGFGGPPGGPRPIIPVRGIFRRRWRRYRLSYSSALSQDVVAAAMASRAGASGRLTELSGVVVWPGGRVTAAGHADVALAGDAAPSARSESSAFARMAGVFIALLPTGVAGKGAARATAAMRGSALRETALSAGGQGARLALSGSAFVHARSTCSASAASAITGRIAAAVRGAARSGGGLAGTLAALLEGSARSAGSGAGRLAGTMRAAAYGVLIASGAAVARLGLAGGVAKRAGAAGNGAGVGNPVGGVGIAMRTASGGPGRAIGITGFLVSGAMRAASGLIGRAAWQAAGAIEIRMAAGASGRMQNAGGVLAGWLRAIAAAFGGLYGRQGSLIFDADFWMVPPATGLVMTALRRRRDAGPYS